MERVCINIYPVIVQCFLPFITFRYTDTFCLDHVIDYCEDCACDPSCKESVSHPRALIRDSTIEGGEGQKQFNIFGSHSESMTSKIVKMSGYPVSVIFLVLSLYILKTHPHPKYWVSEFY